MANIYQRVRRRVLNSIIAGTLLCGCTFTKITYNHINITNMKKSTKKETRYTTKYTRQFNRTPETLIDEPSQTIAGESYSIAELLRKQTQGIMPQLGKAVYDGEDTDHDTPIAHRNTKDISELMEISKKAQDELDYAKEVVEQSKADKKKAKEEAENEQNEKATKKDEKQEA